MNTTATQTVKQATADTQARKSPTTAAAGGSAALVAVAYLGSRWGWDPEMIAMVSVGVGVLLTLGVRYLHQNFPVLLNAIETATGHDLDGDGDIGQ